MADNKYTPSDDGRSPMARGYVLASRVMSIGFQMMIPTALGWWVDSKWKTSPWMLFVGVVLGFVVAMLELVRLARDSAVGNKGVTRRSGES